MDLYKHLPQTYKGFHLRESDGYFIIDDHRIDEAFEVMKNNGLKRLELNPNFFKGSDLSFLKNFDFLEAINIHIKASDISPVNSLRNLKELVIQKKVGGQIDYLKFARLEECYIEWSNQGVLTIFDSASVKKMAISHYDDYELLKFYNLSQLQFLSFINGRMVSLKGIEKLKELIELNLTFCAELNSLDELVELSQLRKLSIQGCVGINNIESVGRLSNLKVLSFSDCNNIGSINMLKSLFQLEELFFIGNTNILDGDLTVLEELRNKGKLKKIVFKNRKHYTHKREQLGYEF